MSKVTVISKLPQFASLTEAAMDMALNNAAVEIIRLSKMQVPHRTGALQSSGRYERKGKLHFEVSYDTPYARRWEYTTPSHGFNEGRKSRYLRDPAEMVTEKRHFEGILKTAAGRVRV